MFTYEIHTAKLLLNTSLTAWAQSYLTSLKLSSFEMPLFCQRRTDPKVLTTLNSLQKG